MRRQVSSTVRSTVVPSASFSRYFMSQICSEIGAAKRVMAGFLFVCGFYVIIRKARQIQPFKVVSSRA